MPRAVDHCTLFLGCPQVPGSSGHLCCDNLRPSPRGSGPGGGASSVLVSDPGLVFQHWVLH